MNFGTWKQRNKYVKKLIPERVVKIQTSTLHGSLETIQTEKGSYMKFFGVLFLLVVLFAALVFFTSCTTVNPIVRSTCDIVKEICVYESLVCDSLELDHATQTREVYFLRMEQLNEELTTALEREKQK